MRPLDLGVDALAAWRLTHLVVADVFPPVAKLREAVLDRYGPESAWSYLATCPYCVGVWAGVAVVVARRRAPRAWSALAEALAVAALVPIIEGKLA
jgi:uncharacterized protein DUF1360